MGEQNQQAKKEIKSRKWVPTVIINEILLKLPVESLLRCKSVCKLWYSIITDPYFVKSHLSLSSSSNSYAKRRLVLFNTLSSNILTSCSFSQVLNDKYVNALELDHPLKQHSSFVRIIGSCNGLLCITTNYIHVERHTQLFVWNPSTKRSKRLPPYSCDSSYLSYGFGYDDSTDDYKLVIISCEGTIYNQKLHIYSLKTEKWKEIEDFDPHGFPSDLYGMFLNGGLHWMGRTATRKDSDHKKRIVCLDLAKETFSEILLPVYDVDNMYNELFQTLGEMLCMLCTHKYGNRTTDVWVMKVYGVKDSWTKLFSIPSYVTDCGGRYTYWQPLCSLNDEKVLLKFGETSFVYDTKNASYTKMKNFDGCYNVYTSFVESLVSPEFPNKPLIL